MHKWNGLIVQNVLLLIFLLTLNFIVYIFIYFDYSVMNGILTLQGVSEPQDPTEKPLDLEPFILMHLHIKHVDNVF